jgi:hypothetical protein
MFNCVDNIRIGCSDCRERLLYKRYTTLGLYLTLYCKNTVRWLTTVYSTNEALYEY